MSLLVATALGLGAFLCALNVTRGQPVFSTEYEIKSVLIYNLAQFVEWPTDAFETASSPIVIGVLGENVFGKSLEKVVEGEMVQNRKLVVQYYRRAAEIQGCNLLFITRSESAHLESVLSQLRGKPTLTVSDIETFVNRGGMVRFVSEKNKVRLRLNMAAIEASRLKVSSKLLRIAELVPK
jgi:YfiR/HmsC-like